MKIVLIKKGELRHHFTDITSHFMMFNVNILVKGDIIKDTSGNEYRFDSFGITSRTVLVWEV
jgi:hypothetical protein